MQETVTADSAAVRQWLRILHGDSEGRIHIVSTDAWSGPSCPPGDFGAAVARVEQLETASPSGIYVRMTTLRGVLKRGTRGGIADSLALPALWADLDIAGPGHKDQNLPPDWPAVRAIVVRSGLPEPTLWINSGHGAYPIWLLRAPHLLGDDLDQVAELSANWQKVIGAASEALGWHYGTGIGDLARVLRIPGTVNRKVPGDPRICHIDTASVTPVRYTLDELHAAASAALATFAPPEPPPLPPPTPAVKPNTTPKPGVSAGAGLSPGDDFAARTSWAEILEPHGWRVIGTRGHIQDWCRPGKEHGISATVNAKGTDRLHVLTSSTAFDQTSYSKLGAYAVLNHGGDISAAASALKAMDYGTNLGRNDQAIQDYLSGRSDELPPTFTRDPPPVGSAAGEDPESPLDPKVQRELKYRHEIAMEAYRQKIRREARKMIDADEFGETWRVPPSRPTLSAELAEPDDPVRYRVDKLLTVGGNALLAAGFKAGKTTLCNNLLRSLADGEPFLDRFEVVQPDGRIAVFNYEVSEGQFRHWLRRIGIRDTDRVCVLNLRGYRLPLIHTLVEDWVSKWLTEHEVRTWVVDPFARAMVGCGDENSNTDVGVMLDVLDVIKSRAGVTELILPTHTGRQEQQQGSERARGATRLDDWADARWLLTTDDQGRRFFRAAGRDVDVDEELLSFDAATGRLSLGGHDRRGMARRDKIGELVEWVRENPGLGKDEIVAQFGGQRTAIYSRLSAAVAARDLYTVTAARGKLLHYVTGTVPPGTLEVE